jgi:hypothetical protein
MHDEIGRIADHDAAGIGRSMFHDATGSCAYRSTTRRGSGGSRITTLLRVG